MGKENNEGKTRLDRSRCHREGSSFQEERPLVEDLCACMCFFKVEESLRVIIKQLNLTGAKGPMREFGNSSLVCRTPGSVY